MCQELDRKRQLDIDGVSITTTTMIFQTRTRRAAFDIGPEEPRRNDTACPTLRPLLSDTMTRLARGTAGHAGSEDYSCSEATATM
ncbi:hypothetical protein CEP54_009572 [Fusarium duplospermum]|uniref:Uncharacterized protein n=1 Tax=Fusarium duplospermum TaxID=1325734 RepID=A0A428PPQ6_9HYPO|nr:hypothetical protein CEP54_009572 [Fusarium duplospermum]